MSAVLFHLFPSHIRSTHCFLRKSPCRCFSIRISVLYACKILLTCVVTFVPFITHYGTCSDRRNGTYNIYKIIINSGFRHSLVRHQSDR